MTAPSFVDALLCLVQVSVVAGSVLFVRSCVARRLPASRAVIGAVGMACVLVVSGSILLPRVRFWPASETTAVHDAGVSNLPEEDASRGMARSARTDRQSISTEDSSTGIAFSSAWLRRFREGLRDSIVRAEERPAGGRLLWPFSWRLALESARFDSCSRSTACDGSIGQVPRLRTSV